MRACGAWPVVARRAKKEKKTRRSTDCAVLPLLERPVGDDGRRAYDDAAAATAAAVSNGARCRRTQSATAGRVVAVAAAAVAGGTGTRVYNIMYDNVVAVYGSAGARSSALAAAVYNRYDILPQPYV